MTKIDTFQLRKTIPQEEFDYGLLTGALSEYAGVRQKINELLKSGVILRVKKGLYVFGPAYNKGPVCKEVLANLIYGPSCISLSYALSYHGLIPERVETVTSVTPKRDKDFQTPLGQFSYRYLGGEKYPHGIEQVWVDSKHPVLMASPEKAICDYVVLNKVTGITDSDVAREFLEVELRIDRESWTRFDANVLGKLNKFYRNENIEHIVEAL
jgi:predicted transcriptional regulator of viral defense system